MHANFRFTSIRCANVIYICSTLSLNFATSMKHMQINRDRERQNKCRIEKYVKCLGLLFACGHSRPSKTKINRNIKKRKERRKPIFYTKILMTLEKISSASVVRRHHSWDIVVHIKGIDLFNHCGT